MKIGRIVSDTTKAFEQALWFCRVFGLDWKEYILPFNKNGMLGRVLCFRRNKINSNSKKLK